MNWKDDTSYSRTEGRRQGQMEPQTWAAVTANAVKLCVTRHIHGEPGHWYLRSEFRRLDMNDLGTDLEDAKAEAVRATKALLRLWLGDLDE